jgi:hypothetical protein
MSAHFVYIDGKDRGCIGNTLTIAELYDFLSTDEVAQKSVPLLSLLADGGMRGTTSLLRDLEQLRTTQRAQLRERASVRSTIAYLIRAIRKVGPSSNSLLEIFDEDSAFEAYPEEGDWDEPDDDFEDDERNRGVFTMFSFGYWGWGNATEKLVQIVDAVEKARGFKPPVFVDVRLRRSGRAEGFVGDAFAEVVGERRYVWLPKLGNQNINSKKGTRIRIADPSAATELLELAEEKAQQNRRVIFFCACDYPRWEGAVHCHRATIAKLLLRRAKAKRRSLRIDEWPGGERRELELRVPPEVLRKAKQGSIPLGDAPDLARVGRVRIGSLVTLLSSAGTVNRVVDRPIWRNGQWVLPVPKWFAQPKDGSFVKYECIARRYQKSTDFSQTVE